MTTSLVATHEIEAVEISAAAHREIADALRAAGHDRAFSQADLGILIDMTGFGLVVRAESPRPPFLFSQEPD